MTTEPAGLRPGAETATIIPGYRLAEVKVTSALHQLGQIAHFVARERDTAVREREAALQEAGRLRARVEELESWLRALVANHADIEDADPSLPLHEARVLLGLDGATGARDVNAEVGRG